ncbi:nicotinate (nicotinamide) nucleotide adenylyltransferase [Variovorax sp. J22P168]|uniref:nicotinate (nicotinamide) nucleotide adenylyltransferase n=1 Tax=Variovorax jilinensis TaxID=3053513 RepID=UPI002576626D|nr:nicotinate (nicotinamide) nucleotide adenylyltransferase [Variovorax sp. J22P168]MDM0013393.1 nicotinate (nicotinamide) nucleotide adenylyltransferase [Variovorax sp. J22P168]
MALADPAVPRLGVFGGAFDPPHLAHVALVQAALAQLQLSELRIFPTGQAWHKARRLSAAEDRLAMAHLAFDGIAGARVDERETLRPGPTYTLDTLRELKREQPLAQPVLIVGADQALALPSWHGFEEILAIAIISVANRAQATGSSGPFDPGVLPNLPSGARFEPLELPSMDVSATDIRARAARGEALGGLVPPAVARYIDKHLLYRSA